MSEGWSTIEIGGKIPTSLVQSLCSHIRDAVCRVVGSDTEYRPIDVDDLLLTTAKDTDTLHLECLDRYGFDSLVGFLEAYNIPYVVTQHGVDEDSLRAVYRPDSVLRVWHGLGGNEEPLPSMSLLADLFTLRRIVCSGCYGSGGEDLLRRLLMQLLADADPNMPPLPTLEFCDA